MIEAHGLTKRLDDLAVALRDRGLVVTEEPIEDALRVAGITTERVGELAGGLGLVLHELTTVRGSLEEAFMEITKQDVEYAAGVPA